MSYSDYERYEQAFEAAAEALGVPEIVAPWVTLVAANSRVLDLGCSVGRQTRHLVDRGCTVVGVEIDRAAAHRAAAWCERVVVCDLDSAHLRAALEGEQFDFIVAGDILEHLRDPLALLVAVQPLLLPRGKIVASVPNIAHGSVLLALATGQFPYSDTGILDRSHLRFFTVTSITELFQSAGFKVERIDRVQVSLDQAVQVDGRQLPREFIELVESMPEARTFQIIVTAVPDRAATRPLEFHQLPTETAVSPEVVLRDDVIRQLEETIVVLREENRALKAATRDNPRTISRGLRRLKRSWRRR